MLLDTHIVVWLYEDAERLLPAAVLRRLDQESLVLSPFVRLELQYLHEIGKLSVSPATLLDYLMPSLEMTASNPAAAPVCEVASTMDWTRDPFDRLLSAEAASAGMTLLTKDRTIRKHLSHAWWPGK